MLFIADALNMEWLPYSTGFYSTPFTCTIYAYIQFIYTCMQFILVTRFLRGFHGIAVPSVNWRASSKSELVFCLRL